MPKPIRYGRELPGYPFNARALVTRGIIVVQRKVFGEWLRAYSDHAPLELTWRKQEASDAIFRLLSHPSPCMISRFGSGEMETTLRHLDIVMPGPQIVKFLKMFVGKSGPYWWDNSIRAGMNWIAGLFPPTNETLDRFGELVLNDCQYIDMLVGWLAGERRLHSRFFPKATCIPLNDLEPFSVDTPWSMALEGKTVLIVHPFESTIRHQYARREQLFTDSRVLPPFTLKTYKTVQSLAGNAAGFETWFDALEHMCHDISRIEFDIALIGAGAYGMSIAAHIKRMGKKAVHMGGITQLLFGIKGGRWDNIPYYAQRLYNDAWIRPLPEDCPLNYKTVENGSYW